MVKDSHKPPSRIRYEQSHPTISFRVSRETHDKLKEHLIRRRVSFADFVKESLGIQQLKIPDIGKIKETNWIQGYNKAMEKYEITIRCHRCRQPMTVTPNSPLHQTIMDYIEGAWSHTNCEEKYGY